jgi:hypothetical protein
MRREDWRKARGRGGRTGGDTVKGMVIGEAGEGE